MTGKGTKEKNFPRMKGNLEGIRDQGPREKVISFRKKIASLF
jgi:hypothetical protein